MAGHGVQKMNVKNAMILELWRRLHQTWGPECRAPGPGKSQTQPHTVCNSTAALQRDARQRQKRPQILQGPSAWLTWWRDPGLHKRKDWCSNFVLCPPHVHHNMSVTVSPHMNTHTILQEKQSLCRGQLLPTDLCSRIPAFSGEQLSCIQLTCRESSHMHIHAGPFPPCVMTYFCEKIKNQLNTNPKEDFFF